MSRDTVGNVKQNLFFAFVLDALGVSVATGVVYPFFDIPLSPVIAAQPQVLARSPSLASSE